MRFATLHDAGVSVLDCEHKTPAAQTDGYPYIAIPDIHDGYVDTKTARKISESDYLEWTRRTKPVKGDVTVTRRARVGDTGRIPSSHCAIGQNLVILRSSGDQCRQDYLYWTTRSPKWSNEVDRYLNVGAVFSSLNVRDIGSIEIPLPPLPEQQAIAEVLGALDDKIAANRKLVTTMESYLRALFDKNLANADQPLRSLDDLVELNPKYPSPSEPAALIPMQSLPTPSIVIPEFTHGAPKGGARFKNDDTLLARITPCLENGKTGYVGCLDRDEIGIGSTEYIVMHSTEPYPPQLSYFIATDPTFRSEAIRRMTGTSGRQRVKAQDISEVPIHMTPDREVIKSFGELAAYSFRYAESLSGESGTLARLRDTLLPALMDGRIRVKDAQETVEEVL